MPCDKPGSNSIITMFSGRVGTPAVRRRAGAASVFSALVLVTVSAYGLGWVGEAMVNRPGVNSSNAQPCIAVDRAGAPWLAWVTTNRAASLSYTKWLGSAWDPEQEVGPNYPGVISRPQPRLAFDNRGSARLSWVNQFSDNHLSVATCASNPSGWDPEIPVSPPDSGYSDFGSSMAWGGGRFWYTLDRAPTQAYDPFSVFASLMDSTTPQPTQAARVSPPDSGYHWFSSVAVDAQGHPHVVWVDVWHYVVLYSFFDGNTWSTPTPVNDTTRVRVPDRAQPRIAIDRQGGLHVCFTGVAAGAASRDIFYSKNRGRGWAPSALVSQDSAYNEWYSDIAVGDSDNVWVVWNRQGEGSDQFRIYAAHFDGDKWSEEVRLDGDQAYYDGGPRVVLDLDENPWVVWDGMTYGGPDLCDIYFNRFSSADIAEPYARVPARPALSLTARSESPSSVQIAYYLPAEGDVSLTILDQLGRSVRVLYQQHQAAGSHAVDWDCRDSRGRPVPFSVLFCRARARGIDETYKFIKTAGK